MKFNLNLLELSFLGKDLYTVTIYQYPMLILEFMDGNYTTTELFQRNNLLISGNDPEDSNNIDDNSNSGNFLENMPEINSINDEEESSQIYEKKDDTFVVVSKDMIQGTLEEENGLVVSSSATEIKKTHNKNLGNNKIDEEKDNKKDKKNKKNKNKKKTKVYSKEIKMKKIDNYGFNDYLCLYLEKILFFRDELNKVKKVQSNQEKSFNLKIDNYEKIIELYKRKERINQIKRKIEFYRKKNVDIKNLKEKIQDIICNKKYILGKLNEKIYSYKEKYTELQNNKNTLVPLIAKKQLIYDSFLNKKMAEICFFFFNKKIKSLYFIPDFLKIPLKNDNDSVKRRIEYYNKYKKEISSMMGYITQLMIYMSKCFDIPLRYPLMLNGAKSFIIKGKKDKDKDFLPLHCDLKRDDKYSNFENGLNYLKSDFKEIINFCSMYPEIIPENENNKSYKENDDNTFFSDFLYFNRCLGNFIKYIIEMFEQ